MPEIEAQAARYDLDMEDMAWDQFLVAKEEGRILGFGRIRPYPDCAELATVGVTPELRKTGIGASIVKELIRTGPKELYVTCVIPGYFRRFGFEEVKIFPSVLQKKIDFCKCYGYTDGEVHIMKHTKL